MVNNIKEEDVWAGHPMAAVPKLTTYVNFNKLNDGHIIISFFSSIEKYTKNKTLIETIIVDEKHAQEIVNTLQEVIDKEI